MNSALVATLKNTELRVLWVLCAIRSILGLPHATFQNIDAPSPKIYWLWRELLCV